MRRWHLICALNLETFSSFGCISCSYFTAWIGIEKHLMSDRNAMFIVAGHDFSSCAATCLFFFYSLFCWWTHQMFRSERVKWSKLCGEASPWLAWLWSFSLSSWIWRTTEPTSDKTNHLIHTWVRGRGRGLNDAVFGRQRWPVASCLQNGCQMTDWSEAPSSCCD